jgi:hypothetical protein
MDENPYKAPADTGEPLPAEPKNRHGVAWAAIAVGVTIIVAMKLLGWIAF